MISLCMIARDEARDLPRCLASVAGVVDEVVVADTGSRDETARLAVAYGARVIPCAWQDDFAAARNAVLAHAAGDWVLILDADEELDREHRSRLRTMVEAAPWDAARLRVRNLQPPGELCDFYDARLTRLFRTRPEYRFQGAIHEQITPAIVRAGGQVVDLDLTVIHHGYARRVAQDGVERPARNLALLERMVHITPDDPYLHYQLGVTYKSLKRARDARAALQRALADGEDTLGPDTADLAHMKLAQLALADGNLVDAIRHAEASLGTHPDNLLSLHVLALALLFRGDVAEAYARFRTIRTLAVGHIADTRRLDAVLTHCRHLLESSGDRAEGRAVSDR